MNIQSLVDASLVADSPVERAELAGSLAKERLVNVVATLGPVLTGDERQRAGATRVLADVVAAANDLPPRDGALFSKFFATRLEDEPSLESAVSGLKALVARHTAAVDAAPVLAAVRALPIRQMPQPLRMAIFELLREFRPHVPVSEFVPVFADVASGEKDPHTLLVSLAISRAVLANDGDSLDRNLCVDIYDVTFCYFPVTFTPPRDMPNRVSGDDLRLSLRRTLASPALAELVIPALIEKLTAVSISVKVDALETLAAVLQALDPTQISAHFEAVWTGIRFEVLHGTPENATFAPSIAVLAVLGKSQGSLLEAGVRAEIDRAGVSLQMAHLVVGIASLVPDLWPGLVPTALDVLFSSDTPPSPAVLRVFVSGAKNASLPLPGGDRVLHNLVTSADAEGLKEIAILDPEYAPLAVQALTSQRAAPELAMVAKGGRSDTVLAYSVPDLMADWPAGLPVLGQVCVTRPLVHALFVRLLGRLASNPGDVIPVLQSLLHAVKALTDEDRRGLDRFVPQLLSLFQDKQESESNQTDAASMDGIEDVVEGVETIESSEETVVRPVEAEVERVEAVETEAPPEPMEDIQGSEGVESIVTPEESVVRPAGAVVERIEAVGDDNQKTASSPANESRATEARQKLDQNQNQAKNTEKEEDAMVELASMLIELCARTVVADAEKAFAAKIPAPSMLPFALWLAAIAPLASPPLSVISMTAELEHLRPLRTVLRRASVLRFIAVATNKWTHIVEDLSVLQTIDLSDPDALELTAWATKGLLMRLHPLGVTLAERLVTRVPSDSAAARVFGAIAAPDRIASQVNGLTVRKLMAQRLWTVALPVLLPENTTINTNCLLALSMLVRYTPPAVVAPSWPRLVPAFLVGIERPDSAPPQAQKVALDSLSRVVPVHPDLVEDRVPTLVRELIALAQHGRTSGVRGGAVILLAVIRAFAGAQQCRDDILAGLVPALDDTTRSVRQLAAQTRHLYFEL